MSEVIEVKTLIFDNLKYEVPSTVEEYNALDTKRVQAGRNPCLEDAVDDTMKHTVLGQFRSKFLEAVGKKYEIARINRGTKENPKWETDGEMMDRVIATVAQQRGLDPAADATETAIRDELFELAQTTLSAIKFSVAGRERTGGGGQLVGKNDIKLATDAFDNGKATRLAELLGKFLGRTVDVSGDKEAAVLNLARALKDKRKADADAREAELKAALG